MHGDAGEKKNSARASNIFPIDPGSNERPGEMTRLSAPSENNHQYADGSFQRAIGC